MWPRRSRTNFPRSFRQIGCDSRSGQRNHRERIRSVSKYTPVERIPPPLVLEAGFTGQAGGALERSVVTLVEQRGVQLLVVAGQVKFQALRLLSRCSLRA
jgi:hypothetical protein